MISFSDEKNAYWAATDSDDLERFFVNKSVKNITFSSNGINYYCKLKKKKKMKTTHK